jgi:hypothetical protein
MGMPNAVVAQQYHEPKATIKQQQHCHDFMDLPDLPHAA